MLFSSVTFLYWFLPAALALYFLAPARKTVRARNCVLLAVSVVFYAWGEPRFVALLAAQTLAGWVFGLLIERKRGTKMSRLWLILCVIAMLCALGYFKYAGFAVTNVNLLTGAAFAVPEIVLPLGISFYTFQIISYAVDVYRGDVRAQRKIVAFAAYVAMFPQLVAGPIVRYADVERALTERTHTLSDFAQGARRFAVGLAKKVLLANVIGEFNALVGARDSVLASWLYAVTFGLHVYYDFSGYSDMAIGLGRIFGFRFPENFNYPFISRSITEFWRRWHMSLSYWFRDYVYIPLGGSRKGVARQVLSIMTVWLLTGIWHGAGWNFALWGLYFGLVLLLEKFVFRGILERAPVILRHAYTMLVVVASWVIFGAENATGIVARFASMFTGTLTDAETLYWLRSYAIPLIVAVIGSTPLPQRIFARLTERTPRIMVALEPLAIAAFLLITTAYLADGSFNPFIYFRF